MKRAFFVLAAIAAFLGFGFSPVADCGNCKVANSPLATINFVAPAMAGKLQGSTVVPRADKEKFVYRWRVAYEGCKREGPQKASVKSANSNIDPSISAILFFEGKLIWIEKAVCGEQIVYTEGGGGWQITPPSGVQAIRLQVSLVPRSSYEAYKNRQSFSWDQGSRLVYDEPSR